MKNKFLNLNILLLLFLCLIGFSPQSNSLFSINTVYALDNVDSILTNTDDDGNVVSGINNDKFTNQIGDLVNKLDNENAATFSKNISESIKMMTNIMSNISTAASGFALTLSVVIVAIIGFKVINSGTGDVITFMKQKKDISNAIVCIIFILAIPYFVRSVLEFKPPTSLLSPIDSNYKGDVNIGDIVTTPKSGLKDYIIANKTTYELSNEDRIASGPFWEKGFEVLEEGGKGSSLKGLVNLLFSALLAILAMAIYSPLLLFTSFLGSISFFPVSLDVAMYATDGTETVAKIAQSFFDTTSQSAMAGIGTNGLTNVAKTLASLTSILNVLYFLIKKFVMLCLEFVCYYYGIMHLLNKDKDDVGKFLVRLAQGVIGITLFPFLVEFLLDVDGLIATAILRITGPALLGFSILSVLPTVAQAAKGFTILFFSVIFCSVVFSLAKSFFIRRIEISLYYLASPIFFLKHIMSPNDGGVKQLTSRITSAIFLTTTYAPVLAIVNLLLTLAMNNPEIGVIFLVLVIGVLFLGKGVIADIIRKLTGESASISSAGSQFERGISRASKALNTVEKGAKNGAGALAFGATTAALNNAGSIKNGIKNAPKTLTDRETWKKAAKTITNKKSWQNGAKAIGSGVMRTGKGALNVAENQFWEKYNKAEKRYGKFNATEAETQVLKNRMGYGAAKIDRKDELESTRALNKLINSKDPNDKENFKKYYDFHKNHKKLKENHVSFLDEAKQSRGKLAEMAEISGNQDIQKSFDEYDKILNSTDVLMRDRDDFIKDGNIGAAYDVDMQIQGNRKYLKKYEDTIYQAYKSNENLQKKAKGLVPLRVLANNPSGIQPQGVKFTNDANTIVASMNSIKELDSFKNNTKATTEIESIITSVENGDFANAQNSIQSFVASQSANLSIADKAKFNSHLETMIKTDAIPMQQFVNTANTAISTPKIQFRAGEVKGSMEKLKEIDVFKNNKESMKQINSIIEATGKSSVDDIRNKVDEFVSAQLSSNKLNINDTHAFREAFKGVYNGNMSDVQKFATNIAESSKQYGEQYHSQVSALASNENTDILDYIAVSSGINSDKHKTTIEAARKTLVEKMQADSLATIKKMQNDSIKQHISIIKQGVNEDSAIRDSEYGKLINSIDLDSVTMTDFFKITSGENEAHYNSVAKSIAKNISESTFNSAVPSIIREELKTNFNPKSTSDFSFKDLNECITKAGGFEQLRNAYTSSNSVYIKSGEVTREKITNLPKAAEFNVTIKSQANSNSSNDGGNKNTKHEGND